MIRRKFAEFEMRGELFDGEILPERQHIVSMFKILIVKMETFDDCSLRMIEV